MTQRALFDPARTVATACPVPGCAAIRQPGQTTVPTCHIDRTRPSEYVTRPPGCLNYPQPEHQPIPY